MKNILWDVDQTLWFYPKNESKYFLEAIGIKWNEDIQKNFENYYMNEHDQHFKDKKITRNEICDLLEGKMQTLKKYNLSGKDFFEAWINYSENEINPDSKNVLKTLNERNYKQFVLTDWIEFSQERQLKKFELMDYIEKIYGIENDYLKSNPKRVKNIIPKGREKDYIMIGDSLEADGMFAKNAKIDFIWFNRKNKENNTDIKPTYVVNKLTDILNILK